MKKTTLSAAIALAFMISAPVWAGQPQQPPQPSDPSVSVTNDANGGSTANQGSKNEQENNSGAQAQNNSTATSTETDTTTITMAMKKWDTDISKSFNTTVEAKTVLIGSVKDNDAFQGNIAKGGSADAHADGGESGKAMAMSHSGEAEANGGRGGSAFSGAGADSSASNDIDGEADKTAALSAGAAKSTANGGNGAKGGKATSAALAAAKSGMALGGAAFAKATGGNAGSYYVSNCLSNSLNSAAGIVAVAQNNGANSLIQQGATVQANMTIH